MKNNKAAEKRAAERVQSALLVRSGGVTGVTRDVSASGIFFEIDRTYDVGKKIRFVVELDSPTGKMHLNCTGSIVRVQDMGSKVGVAVKIVESQLTADE